jgi:hypothetical protein
MQVVAQPSTLVVLSLAVLAPKVSPRIVQAALSAAA